MRSERQEKELKDTYIQFKEMATPGIKKKDIYAKLSRRYKITEGQVLRRIQRAKKIYES